MNKILVVGGYGDVGKHVVTELLTITSGQIVVAGRDGGKAKRLAERLNDARVSGMRIDVYDSASYLNKLSGVELVIMCLNPRDTDFSKYCLSESIHYIDISPSSQVADGLIDLHDYCKKIAVTGVLGVGLCPGISTLVASDLAASYSHIEKIDVSLMLGMGDEYGNDSIGWLLANLDHSFTWVKSGTSVKRRPFKDRVHAEFSPERGSRSAYEFNLADQQILSRTIEGSDVSTYFCYDIRLVTWLVHVMAGLGVFKLLRFSIPYRVIAKIIELLIKLSKSFASDYFAINVKITGRKAGRLVTETTSFSGTNSARMTGRMVAQTASKLIEEPTEPGVFYLNQLFQLKDFNV
ncbi:MAG: saccharopine dehydrogenase NADP-binding domain-containing protein [Propionibacteriaceae bacterium]|jgi:saccharopine dehydrogenase-like NADP-dependent oxidoreductase|nr:saccharopine dehydrogenase NADP-binding domain-containing protein [Propionibacteriaceae bacterium]